MLSPKLAILALGPFAAGILPFSCDVDVDSPAVPTAADTNPDPHIFETTLVATPHSMTIDGEEVTVFSYEGSVPGPTITVHEGDRVIVHFENDLPEGWNSTIHWHGIEGSNASDGTPVTQLAVQPGESFTYDFIAPRAGTFWYHPHIRGVQSVFGGLYGALIVTSDDEAELVDRGILPMREETLIFSDITAEAGAVRDLSTISSLEAMNGTEGKVLLVNGQEQPEFNLEEGEGIRLRLINTSVSRYYRLSVPGHHLVRFGGEGGLLDEAVLDGGMQMGMSMGMPATMCMSNADCAGSDYPMCLEMGTGMKMCGGTTMVNHGYAEGEIVLAPGNRAQVVLIPNGNAGDTVNMVWKDFARGRHAMDMEMPQHMCMMSSDCTNPDFPTCMKMSDNAMMSMCGSMHDADDDGDRADVPLLSFNINRSTHPLADTFEPGTELLTALGNQVETLGMANVDMTGTSDRINFQGWMDTAGTHFAVDGEAWDLQAGTIELPGLSPTARVAQLGDTVMFEVHNHTEMHHPFHLHGFSFQPVRFMEMNHDEGHMVGWPVQNTEFIDTIDIPGHTSFIGKVRLDDPAGGDQAAGRWLFHCHILQHGERGMMSELVVSPE